MERRNASKASSALIATMIGIAIAALCTLCLLPGTARAAQPTGSDQPLTASASLDTQASKVKNVTIFDSKSNTNPVLSKTVSKYDITGDGKKDKIKFKIDMKMTSYAERLRIYVNGKLRYTTYGYKGNGFIAGCATAKYLRLKNGKPFLFVKCDTNNGDGTHDVLQYRKGKLKAVVSNSQLPTDFGNHNQIRSVVASGNTIKVKFMMMTCTVGTLNFTYNYKMKNGTLKRTSSQTSKLGYPMYVGTSLKEAKHYAAARQSFSTYKSTALNKYAFTVSAGQKVKISKICCKSGNLYLRITTKSGKSGWMRALTRGLGTYGGNTLFEGTYMAG